MLLDVYYWACWCSFRESIRHAYRRHL